MAKRFDGIEVGDVVYGIVGDAVVSGPVIEIDRPKATRDELKTQANKLQDVIDLIA